MSAEDQALVTFIVEQEGLLEALLEQHVDDGRGQCQACPGPQGGRRNWPCDVRLAADRAAEIARERRAAPPPAP